MPLDLTPGSRDLAALLRVKYNLAALKFQLAAHRLAQALATASFNPNQPRVPAGVSEGGRWTSGDGGGRVQLAQGAPGLLEEPIIPGESDPRRGPEPLFRIVLPGPEVDTQDLNWITTARDAEAAVNTVRRLEPDWLPGENLYNDTQGAIAANRAVQAEAEARLFYQRAFRFGHNGPPEPSDPASMTAGQIDPDTTLDRFRTMEGLPDLFGLPADTKSDGTVAKADIGGAVLFGVNSDSKNYTPQDRAAANAMRDQLIRKYPGLLKTKNIGQKPNDSLYHAEATALMRWARALGGSLKGHRIEILTDREICPSCVQVIPSLAFELGNPEVVIMDPAGTMMTAKDGAWQ